MAAKAEQLLQQLNVPAAAGRLDNNCTDAFLRGLSKKNLGCSWEELAGILGVAAKDVEGENEQEKFEDVLQKWKEKNEDNCSYR